jgi:alpha-ribazole phosphatase
LRRRLTTQKIACVYASELSRAVVTARTIASVHKLSVISRPELNEINFGDIEGLTYTEIQARYPATASSWRQRSLTLAYPGGESLSALDKRAACFRGTLGQLETDMTALIVAHSGVLRSLICQLLGMDLANRWNIRLDLASLSIVDCYAEMAILSILNDTSHLKEER